MDAKVIKVFGYSKKKIFIWKAAVAPIDLSNRMIAPPVLRSVSVA